MPSLDRRETWCKHQISNRPPWPLIVGDRAVIEEPLRKTGIAPIVMLGIDGKPIANAVTP